MKKYKQLTHKERYQIYALIKEGYSFTKIANNIGVNKSTISREIKRNSVNKNEYNPESASIKTFIRHRDKHKFIKIDNRIQKWIRKLLKLDWSPEQIAGSLKEKKIANITHEAIYQYIYKNKANSGRLYLHLARKIKKYHERDSIYRTRGDIVNKVPISKRPKIVDKKVRIGDWEVDTIIGKYHKGVIVTIVDRKSKFTLMRILPSKEAIKVANAITELLYPIRQFTLIPLHLTMVKSLVYMRIYHLH